MKRLFNKKYRNSLVIILLVIFVFIQAVIIGKLYSERHHQPYEVNLVKINHEKDSIDIPKMKYNLEILDQVIRRINTFLVSKEISQPQIQLLAQDSLSDVVYIAKISNKYSQYLIDLEKKIQIIPLGLPTNEGYISSPFGKRKNPIPITKMSDIVEGKDSLGNIVQQTQNNPQEPTQFHKGIDIALPYGTDIRCTALGKVIFVGEKKGYGKCIIISHNHGLATLYAHLSKILVEVNDQVKVHQIIAKSGNSGRSTGPHLHYEILHNNTPVNPKLFLDF